MEGVVGWQFVARDGLRAPIRSFEIQTTSARPRPMPQGNTATARGLRGLTALSVTGAGLTAAARRSARRGGGRATAAVRTAAAAAADDGGAKKKVGVLFVCLGNICRSPTSEAVFRAVVERRGLAEYFDIDSCGTGGGNANWYQAGGFSYHEGDPADPRMTAAAKKRDVLLTSCSRPLRKEDYDRFDSILGMEAKNIVAAQTAGRHWGISEEVMSQRLDLLPRYCKKTQCQAVPDPWYIGTEEAFNNVLDLVEDACEGLLDELCTVHGISVPAGQ
mmetsp:Transcript_51513/g.122497  ORF Transcript_51513/g.122497 Transcript_51513/m.122497 type:complete len:275 (-) Transcript_51513:55-879(-)